MCVKVYWTDRCRLSLLFGSTKCRNLDGSTNVTALLTWFYASIKWFIQRCSSLFFHVIRFYFFLVFVCWSINTSSLSRERERGEIKSVYLEMKKTSTTTNETVHACRRSIMRCCSSSLWFEVLDFDFSFIAFTFGGNMTRFVCVTFLIGKWRRRLCPGGKQTFRFFSIVDCIDGRLFERLCRWSTILVPIVSKCSRLWCITSLYGYRLALRWRPNQRRSHNLVPMVWKYLAKHSPRHPESRWQWSRRYIDVCRLVYPPSPSFEEAIQSTLINACKLLPLTDVSLKVNRRGFRSMLDDERRSFQCTSMMQSYGASVLSLMEHQVSTKNATPEAGRNRCSWWIF